MAKKIDLNQRDRLVQLFPGYNCGICGYARCDEFAAALLRKHSQLEKCHFMYQELFDENLKNAVGILKEENIIAPEKKVVGVLDGYEADFILKPLPEEQSCREVLYPFTREELKAGEIIRYRPLGCPIIHFARILEENHGLITVVMVGPCHRVDPEVDFPYKEVGICMVGGFEGLIEGKIPAVGETVRFLPGHCMMQKVHSGVVVQVEGKKAIIEGIDLKVWAPPIKG
ncbi:MAG: (Fe-S)-binding protein [Methanobacteriaceae archaeon]|nr:(Fe-S)-binding protein [Methanobacteriaceae archaeon]